MKTNLKTTFCTLLVLFTCLGTGSLSAKNQKTTGEKVDELIEKTEEMAEKAKETAKEVAENALEKAEEIHELAKEKAHDAIDNL